MELLSILSTVYIVTVLYFDVNIYLIIIFILGMNPNIVVSLINIDNNNTIWYDLY